MLPEEIFKLAETGAVAGLCPVTEANLGDGIFNGSEYVSIGVEYGIGSDSNDRISLTKELRMLEHSQRIVRKERNIMTDSSGSLGESLYKCAVRGGARHCHAIQEKLLWENGLIYLHWILRPRFLRIHRG